MNFLLVAHRQCKENRDFIPSFFHDNLDMELYQAHFNANLCPFETSAFDEGMKSVSRYIYAIYELIRTLHNCLLMFFPRIS